MFGVVVSGLVAAPANAAPGDEGSLRFYGYGNGDVDRVKIAVDDPDDAQPGPPADIGATDFTVEFWLRSKPDANQAGAVVCGENNDWINGNIVIDRDRFNQDCNFGMSLAHGRVVFGVSGNATGVTTICGTTDLRDDEWHHIAVQRRRSDGRMTLYIDGVREARGDGPNGDVSYPDNGVPGNYCDGPCDWSDPFLVVGAEKHDAGSADPSFAGWIDELRLSTVERYTSSFTPRSVPFVADSDTAALFHFDDGTGNVVTDEMGQSHGERRYGGAPAAGPRWRATSPFGDTPTLSCSGRSGTIIGTNGSDVLL